MYSRPSSIAPLSCRKTHQVEEEIVGPIYKTMARAARAKPPMPEPTLEPELAWIGPVAVAEADGALGVPEATAVVPGTTGAVGVGGEAGPVETLTIGIVVVPGAVTG